MGATAGAVVGTWMAIDIDAIEQWKGKLSVGADLEQAATILAGTTANNLIPRPGTPAEVAQAIRFVIENDFVTGTTVDVDGGALLP